MLVISAAMLAMFAAVLGGHARAQADVSKGAAEPALEVLASLVRGNQPTFDRLAAVRDRAAKGNMHAQHELGASLAVGYGTQPDYAEAARWIGYAAKQGHDKAQFWLGNLYQRGVGVPRNPGHMAAWWRKAALQGNIAAQYALGALYRDGRMVPKDLSRSHAWFHMASGKTGNAFARENRHLVAKRMARRKAARDAAKAAKSEAARRSSSFENSGQGGR